MAIIVGNLLEMETPMLDFRPKFHVLKMEAVHLIPNCGEVMSGCLLAK